MMKPRALALILLFPLTGCIDLPGIDDLPLDEGPGDTTSPDAGTPTPDAGPREPLEVRWVAPAETVYTNGAVELKLEVTGGTADAVELYAGDVRLATLAPPYAFTWDTTSLPEGSYTLKATTRRGDQTFTSESRPVVIDRTPPHVVERTPEPAAQNVSVRQPIQVTFSEPMMPTDINAAAIRLASVDAEYTKSLSFSGDGTVLVVKPESALSAPALLSVTFVAPLRDLAGNALVAPSKAWSWEVPAWLPVGAALSALPDPAGDNWGRTTAQSPSLQVDANGRPVVAWQEKEPVPNTVVKTRIFVSRWTGEAWSLVGSSPSTGSHPLSGKPSLQLDGLGRPLVAWDESSIHVSRWDGTAWQKVGEPFYRAPSGYYISVRPPVLQLKDGDVPVVAWGESDDAFAATWTGAEWASLGSTLSAYTPAAGENLLNALRLTKQGEPVVAWDEQNPENSANTTQVWKWNGGDWARLPELSTPRKVSLGSSLVLDGEDNPILAWMETDTGASPAIQVRRWVGTGWQQLGEKIPLPAKTRGSYIALQALPSGSPILAFSGTDDAGTTKVYVWYWVDGSWKPLGGGVSAPTGFSVGGVPSLALDLTGLPYLAWEQFDGWTTNIHVYRLNR